MKGESNVCVIRPCRKAAALHLLLQLNDFLHLLLNSNLRLSIHKEREISTGVGGASQKGRS